MSSPSDEDLSAFFRAAKDMPDDPAMPRERPEARAGRLTVVETISHHVPGQQPLSVHVPSERKLQSAELSYVRQPTVGPEWHALDLGWFASGGAGMILARNEEGTNFKVYPTPEELAEVKARVVELLIDWLQPTSRILIAPGESARFTPAEHSSIRLRCPSGRARMSIIIFPA